MAIRGIIANVQKFNPKIWIALYVVNYKHVKLHIPIFNRTAVKLLDSDCMRGLKQAISDNLFSQVYTQYLDTYRMTTRERYKRLLLRCPEIVQSINLKDIASYLKVTPTTISSISREITFDL